MVATVALISDADQVSAEWLSRVIGEPAEILGSTQSESSWARHASITAKLASGAIKKYWLKICLHPDSGRSEVDYYLTDYKDLDGAPLVRCYDGWHEPGVGYHLLLDDLSDTWQDRKHAAPGLAHGLALAEALARLHGHHWESRPAKSAADWEEDLPGIHQGMTQLELITGRSYAARFDSHAEKLKARWSQPHGLTLLHGDVNPTNVLTPNGSEAPVYLLDRQPLNGKTPYGLAIYDLAYAIAPWWPKDLRQQHELAIVKKWFESLNRPEYDWEQAQADWALSVEHCLHVPFGWCRNPEEAVSMRGLWEWQLKNIDG